MSPDLNSLPSSRGSPILTSSLAERPRRISFNDSTIFGPSPPSPHSPASGSLQAAATINAGLQHSPGSAPAAGRGIERRRSSLMNNLSLGHLAQPAAGELQNRDASSMNSSRSRRRSILSHEQSAHERSLSLGELHQELENEQEAQVNRLLYMIRLQQDQLAALSREHSQDAAHPSPTDQHVSPRATPSLHTAGQHGPQSLSRQSSSRLSATDASSRGASPALRPVSASLVPATGDFLLGGSRDEPAFYQAETQTLTRENQMLKQRIKELERQILELSVPSQQGLQASLVTTTSTGHDTPVAARAL